MASTFADHFMPNTEDGSPADGPILECWAVVAGLAAAVPRLRLGTLVCGNTYRHPALLANIAATVDNISEGRLVLGLGGGWQVNEHRAFGIDLGRPKERLDWLEEACQILTGMLRQTAYHGDGPPLPGDRRPVRSQAGAEPLPLLVGGGGEKRTMRIAARYADEWNVWSVPEVMAGKVEVLRRHCDDLDRDPAGIAVSTQALVYLSEDLAWLDERRRSPSGRPEMIGTPAEVVDTIAAYRDAGVDEFIVPDWTMGSMARRRDTLDLFMTEVVPQFR